MTYITYYVWSMFTMAICYNNSQFGLWIYTNVRLLLLLFSLDGQKHIKITIMYYFILCNTTGNVLVTSQHIPNVIINVYKSTAVIINRRRVVQLSTDKHFLATIILYCCTVLQSHCVFLSNSSGALYGCETTCDIFRFPTATWAFVIIFIK